MFKQRYVTLGVALCAALGTHAFVFFYINQTNQQGLVVSATPIQIDLLSQQTKKKTEISPKAKTEEVYEKVRKIAVVNNKIYTLEKQVKDSHEQKLKESQKEQDKELSKETKPRAKQSEPSKADTAEVLALPSHAQTKVLANIQYPKKARRRGWEGTAQFEMAVRNQLVDHVVMLASSGYKVLDTAAKKGIFGIENLPIEDGRYQLPVEFRLQ